MKASKIVITGGPSTGKTAVINQLESNGFYCLHEVIRRMTANEKQQEDKIEIVSNPIISVADPMKFNTMLLNARIEQFYVSDQPKNKPVFFDRGVPDVLAYMDCFGQSYGAMYENACATIRYDHIFIMPPWKEIHVADAERYESYEESLRIHECLVHSYEKFNYPVVVVPKASVAERVAFILDHVSNP